MALVGIIMGSTSDWETMRHAADTLDALGVAHETLRDGVVITLLPGAASGARGGGTAVRAATAG